MASVRLRKCHAYVNLLLSEDRVQGEALLVTANRHQVDCISEIIKNILSLPVGKKAKILIAKSRKLLESLANFALTSRKRLLIIHSAARKILEILFSVKARLRAVLLT